MDESDREAVPPSPAGSAGGDGGQAASGGERRVRSYVVVLSVAAAATAVLAASRVLALGPAAFLDPRLLAKSVFLLAALVAVQRFSFVFEWRGHRSNANMDEAVVLVGLLILPAPIPVLLVPLACAVVQVWGRKGLLKGGFNVANHTISAAAAWAGYVVLTHLGAPPLLAALPGATLFVVVSNGFLAGVFARLSGASTLRVFRERFLVSSALHAAVGTGSGFAFFALVSLHPLAVFALAPFAFLAFRYSSLAAQADRELDVHRHLAEVTYDLVGRSDLDAVADRVLGTSQRLLTAGRVSLRLDGDSPDAPTLSWTRESREGAAPGSHGLTVPLPGRSGKPLGELTAHPKPATDNFGDLERELARIIAGQAASAVENARAFLALERAREEALETHERLSKQEKLATVGTLVAGVAHEVGNPLTYIRGSVELSLREAEPLATSADPAVKQAGERLLADLTFALEGVDRVLEITDSLKRVARQGPSGRRVVDLNDVARDVFRVVKVGLPRSVTLALDLPPESAHVTANPSEISQVVLNLVKNAAEAIGDRPGNVTVRSRAIGDKAFLVVEDDGPGIPLDIQANLFQAFFTTKEKGTGLGLNISRRLIEEHGGRLLLRSAPGQGTAFTIELPASAAPEPAPEGEADAASDPAPGTAPQ